MCCSYENAIDEKYIWQGNLVFIIHKEKPTKTGWWRKARTNDNEIVYVLEKPMHKKFNLNNPEIAESRIQHNACVMKATTVSGGVKIFNKFDILASAGAISQKFILDNNYLIDCSSEIFNELLSINDLTVTNGFQTLFKYYIMQSNDAYYMQISDCMQKGKCTNE